MLLRIISSEGPALLYPVKFHDLPDTVSGPSSWATQLNVLSADDLELPSKGSMHALDKSAFIPSILTQVTYDLVNMSIICQFLDGYIDQWPLEDSTCIRKLETVRAEVDIAAQDRAEEIQRDTEQRLAKEVEKERNRLSLPALPPPPAVKLSRHKRQKSLLTSIISMLSSPFSGPSPSVTVPGTCPMSSSGPQHATDSSYALILDPLPPLDSHARRKRARSMLVDIFRRYTLGEVKQNIGVNSYYMWIAHSMLRRASDRLAELVQQTSSRPPMSNVTRRSRSYGARDFPTVPSSFPFFLDLDLGDAEGGSTDTDGSSLHTPTSSTFSGCLSPKSPSEEDNYYDDLTLPPRPRRQNSEPDKPVSIQNNDEEAKLARTTMQTSYICSVTLRLREVIEEESSRQEHMEVDDRQHDASVEIRSRRRAWLNRSLQGSGCYANVRFSVPFNRSPLGRLSWASEDLDISDDDDDETSTSPGMSTYLFPVSEEDEDEFDDLEKGIIGREMELEFGMDDDDPDDDQGLYGEAAVREGSLGEIRIIRPRVSSGNLGAFAQKRCPVLIPYPTAQAVMNTTSYEDLPPMYTEYDPANPFCGPRRPTLHLEMPLSVDASGLVDQY